MPVHTVIRAKGETLLYETKEYMIKIHVGKHNHKGNTEYVNNNVEVHIEIESIKLSKWNEWVQKEAITYVLGSQILPKILISFPISLFTTLTSIVF